MLRCSLRRGFIDEGVERDRSSRILSCCMTSSPLSIKKEDHSSLLGESLWGDRKGEGLSYRSEPGARSRAYLAGSLRSVNDGSKQAVLLKIKVFKPAK